MSNVILGFVVLVAMISAILLAFTVVFGSALLVFSRSGERGDTKSRLPVSGQQVAEQETV
ncbi:MAG: hypothetical protein H6Q40_10 [Deltaproteobacteria bacterium]|jgi:hypothetical protein|nr:hypothetical protein [Deltaproteobacteria bacterium]